MGNLIRLDRDKINASLSKSLYVVGGFSLKRRMRDSVIGAREISAVPYAWSASARYSSSEAP